MSAESGADGATLFHVSPAPQTGNAAVMISEHAAHLGNGNFHQSATMFGAELVRKLGPDVGILIAMSDRTFGMPAALVARLRKGLEAAEEKAKLKVMTAAPPPMPGADPAVQTGTIAKAHSKSSTDSAFPTLDASLINVPAPVPRLQNLPQSIELEKARSGAIAPIALEPAPSPAPPLSGGLGQQLMPPAQPASSACSGARSIHSNPLNIGALVPRNIFNENLGLLLYVPGAWKETKNAKSLQIVDPETGATLEATGMERTGRSVEQWSAMRVPMVAQDFPYLKQIGGSCVVNGNDWGNRIQAVVTEFRGMAPGDSEESTYLLCCVRTESILIAVTINAKSRVAERNRAVYDWIFSRVDVNDKVANGKVEFDNEIVDESTDRTGMVGSGLRLMSLSILANFVMLRFLADAHHLVIIYVGLCILAMSAFGLYRIAQGLLVPLWGKILVFIGLAVPGLNLALLFVLRWLARRYLRSAGYSTGLFGASEAVPKSNHDLRNVLIAALILTLPLYGLIRVSGVSGFTKAPVQAPPFSPADHSFQVQMPGKPMEVSLAPVPGALDSHLYQSLDGEWTYYAGYTEYEKEPEDFAHALDNMAQYYADRALGRIVAERNITFDGGDGKSVKIAQSDGAIAEVNYGFSGSRLYMVEVVYPAAQKDSPKIDEYFASFFSQ
jgi:hypothetical protein